jgi:hypothetical protein
METEGESEETETARAAEQDRAHYFGVYLNVHCLEYIMNRIEELSGMRPNDRDEYGVYYFE